MDYEDMTTLRLRHRLATMGLPYAVTKRSERASLERALTSPRYLEMWLRYYQLAPLTAASSVSYLLRGLDQPAEDFWD